MKNFIAGLGCGLVVGAMLAPKRGELVRSDLLRFAKRFIDNVKSNSIFRKSSASTTRIDSDRESAAEVLNSASREALVAVHGIGQVLADRIIENRPYERVYDVVEKGIIGKSTFVQLRRDLLENAG